MSTSNEAAVEAGCRLVGCGLLLAWNMTVGAACFDYCLWQLAHKDVPWFADVLCGLFIGQFTTPLAVVLFIIKCCGVDVYMGGQ